MSGRLHLDAGRALTTPLTTLTRKGVKFTWSDKAGAAFRELQSAFTFAPILQHFQPELPLSIEADASDFTLVGLIFP